MCSDGPQGDAQLVVDESLIASLQELIEPWAKEKGLSLSLVCAALPGGIAANMTLLSDTTAAALFRRYGEGFGYPLEALGAEVRLEDGTAVTVAGLDPIGEQPVLLVKKGDEVCHMPKPAFDRAWASRGAD